MLRFCNIGDHDFAFDKPTSKERHEQKAHNVVICRKCDYRVSICGLTESEIKVIRKHLKIVDLSNEEG